MRFASPRGHAAGIQPLQRGQHGRVGILPFRRRLARIDTHDGGSLGQGFGIGRPMAGEGVPEWVAAYRLPEEWRAAAGLAWRSSLYDIFRARHCHHLWQDRMVECVQRQEAFPAEGPVCELVARVGELRGEQPEDPSLAALQQALWSVESLGARLLADGQRGAWEAARAGLPQFLQASAAVLAGLDRLAGLPERGPEVSE